MTTRRAGLLARRRPEIVTGGFSGKLDLGLGPMVSTGGEDIFVGAFAP